MIFGGTAEAREMAQIQRRRGRQVVVSVTSEYERGLFPPGTLCHVGRLDGPAMLQYIREVAPHRVVDATHPYAVVGSQNIQRCTLQLGIPCERVKFINLDTAWRDAVEWVCTPEEVMHALKRDSCNVLLGVGAQDMSGYHLTSDLSRLYPRIDPTPEAVAICRDMGFPAENIIAMRGPFSRTLTMALFDEKNIGAVVVADATNSSYLYEMVIPALERGVHVIMYGRK